MEYYDATPMKSYKLRPVNLKYTISSGRDSPYGIVNYQPRQVSYENKMITPPVGKYKIQ